MADIFATVQDTRVVEGAIIIPRYGLWCADVRLDHAPAVTDPVTLKLGDLSLVGYVFRQSGYLGSTWLRIAGGKGGIRSSVGAKGYASSAGVKLSTVLGDLARDTGETITIETDRSLGAFYTREAGPAQSHLNTLCASWFAKADGTIYAGARPSGRITSQFDVLQFNPSFGACEIGTTTSYADWIPGKTFSSPTMTERTIQGVTHRITKDTVRVEVLT